MATVDEIDALLPQTQCARCGYPDCRSYAEAIAANQIAIDRCPPGGHETLQALSSLLQRAASGLDPEVGVFIAGTVAFIDEPLCIGCTKCISACPVDAIIGGPKLMHTVVEALCTGCELCLPPCPMDCIRLTPVQGVTEGYEGWQFPQGGRDRADALRGRYHQHGERLSMEREARRERAAQRSAVADRKAEIAAAVARVRAKRAQSAPGKH